LLNGCGHGICCSAWHVYFTQAQAPGALQGRGVAALPNAALRRHAAEITEEQMKRDVSLGALFSAAVDAKNFVTHLPGRVNRILARLGRKTKSGPRGAPDATIPRSLLSFTVGH
jgi:hypothetical protein